MKVGRPRAHDLFDEIRSLKKKKECVCVCVCVCVCSGFSRFSSGLLGHRKSPGG